MAPPRLTGDLIALRVRPATLDAFEAIIYVLSITFRPQVKTAAFVRGVIPAPARPCDPEVQAESCGHQLCSVAEVFEFDKIYHRYFFSLFAQPQLVLLRFEIES